MIHDLIDEDACEKTNIAGVTTKAYVVCSHDVETFPVAPAYDPLTPGASVTIVGDIILKPLKKFSQFDVITDTGLIRSVAQGNIGSKGFRNEIQVELAGSDPEKLAWWERMLNGCFIMIFEEKNGNKRILGNVKTPAKFDTIEVLNNNEDNKGVGLAYDTTGRIAPIYEGDIDLDELT